MFPSKFDWTFTVIASWGVHTLSAIETRILCAFIQVWKKKLSYLSHDPHGLTLQIIGCKTIPLCWPYATARVGSGGAILSREIRGSKMKEGKKSSGYLVQFLSTELARTRQENIYFTLRRFLHLPSSQLVPFHPRTHWH